MRTTGSFEERLNADFIERGTVFSRVRPDPPRELTYSAGVLSWKLPRDSRNVTHFRIYANTEHNLVREVPVGQTFLQDSLSASRVFISSFNRNTGLESRRVLLNQAISGSGGYFVLTPADAVTPNLLNGEGQELLLNRATTTLATPTNRFAGKELELILIQDGTGGRQIAWNANYIGAHVDIDGRANRYCVFRYRVRTDLKLALTRFFQGTVAWS